MEVLAVTKEMPGLARDHVRTNECMKEGKKEKPLIPQISALTRQSTLKESPKEVKAIQFNPNVSLYSNHQ